MGRPLANQLRDQNVQAVFFLSGMILVAITIFLHGIKNKASKLELSIIIGLVALYVMFFFRLGEPERSHLIEYSVLAIFMHQALIERQRKSSFKIDLLAFTSTFLIGVADESLQFILPNRTFDPEDIVFNGMVSGLAIFTSVILRWIRGKFGSPPTSGNNSAEVT